VKPSSISMDRSLTATGFKRPFDGALDDEHEHGSARVKAQGGDPLLREHRDKPCASKSGMTTICDTATVALNGSVISAPCESGDTGRALEKKPKRVALPPPCSTTPVPCPRCSSEATKFCYYNNYDPQQPRYYCKVRQRPDVARSFGIGFAWVRLCLARAPCCICLPQLT
jgi:hypothetical protein